MKDPKTIENKTNQRKIITFKNMLQVKNAVTLFYSILCNCDTFKIYFKRITFKGIFFTPICINVTPIVMQESDQCRMYLFLCLSYTRSELVIFLL